MIPAQQQTHDNTYVCVSVCACAVPRSLACAWYPNIDYITQAVCIKLSTACYKSEVTSLLLQTAREKDRETLLLCLIALAVCNKRSLLVTCHDANTWLVTGL